MKRLHFILGFLSIIPFLGMSQISKMDEIKTKNHPIVCVAYSPEGSLYATSGYDQTIVVRNPRGEMVKRLSGHKDLVKSLTFNADGK